jgi:hypothetical protein
LYIAEDSPFKDWETNTRLISQNKQMKISIISSGEKFDKTKDTPFIPSAAHN